MSENNQTLSFKLKGTLSSYEYATSPYDEKGAKPMHRLGIKFAEGERDRLKAYCDDNKVFGNTKEGFFPSWYKPRDSHPNDVDYINLKSNFDVTVYYAVDDQDEDNIIRQLSDGKYLAESTIYNLSSAKGHLGGSEVVVRLTVKEGAIYPLALTFKTLNVRTFEDMFDEEDLPFN